MVKQYLYKVYRKTRTTLIQRVLDGDFEGLSNSKFSTYWTETGTPTDVLRSRIKAYNSTLGSALQLDGVTNKVNVLSIGLLGYTPSKNYQYGHSSKFMHVLSYYKAAYTGSGVHYLVHQGTNPSSPTMALYADYGAGNLVASLKMGGTLRTVTYALASISNGLHTIAFGTDGRFLKLILDETEVASYDNTTTVSILDDGAYITLGGINGSNSGYADGTVDYYGFYNALLTASQVGAIHRTRNPQDTNLIAFYDFNEGSGSTVSSIGTLNFGGSIFGTPVWVDGFAYINKCAYVKTNTGGSATQGFKQASGYECNIVGGQTYTANAYINAPAGETINLTITPTGGGSAKTESIVASGNWQQITNVYTANALATKLTVEITMSNANASAKIFYVDKVALNDGGTAYDYFDQDTRSSGSTVYSFNATSNYHTFTMTVYNYIKTWADVVSDFSYPQEINSSGATISVELARDTDNNGEHNDLDFGNEVRIYVVDNQQINSSPIFTGYIENYTTDEKSNNTLVNIFGYGAELDGYLTKAGQKLKGIMPIYNNSKVVTNTYGAYFVQVFTPTENITLRTLYIMTSGQVGASASIYKGDPILNSLNVIGGFATYTIDPSNTLVASAKASISVNTSSATRQSFDFDDVLLYANVQYYVEIGAYGTGSIYGASSTDTPAAYTNFSPFKKGYWIVANINNVGYNFILDTSYPAIYCELWDKKGSTTVTFNSYDPAKMLRDVIDDYRSQGGTLTYDETSIPLTNTTVSYTFKSATVYEVLQKCLELCPVDYYFYINHAQNKIYLKKKSEMPEHYFELGTHIDELKFEKRTETLVNQLLFSGGDLGAGINFYKAYKDDASIALYGTRTQLYSDNRVLVEATADAIANAILDKYSFPEVRVTVTITDDYDIESIAIGDVVGFRNYGAGADYDSLWDIGYWDQAYWDFDISNPATFHLQVARLDYNPDEVTLSLSTTPPDVNKRIEDIKRNLDAQQTINNPTDPIGV